jgi:ribosomal protein S18 acetylase RimI-like enzyme
MNVRNEIDVRPMQAAEIEEVQTLAGVVWRHHYPGIITSAQIEYMLAQRYSPVLLQTELARDDLWWHVVRAAGAIRGFSSFLLSDEPGEMKLDKLYVHPDWQRRGLGGRLIDRALQDARTHGCSRLVLAVNKRNEQAIAAYRRHGFNVAQSVVKDIGGGFVMDDYIMVRAL